MKPIYIALCLLVIGSTAAADQCRDKLAQMVCSVKGDLAFGRPCLGDTKEYRDILLNVYDIAPQSVQGVFCELNHVYVEKDWIMDAYMEPNLLWLGITKSVIDARLNAADYESVYDHSYYFGENRGSINKSIPYYDSANPDGRNYALLRAILHEIGHLHAFRLKIGEPPTADCSKTGMNCEFPTGSFEAISWSRYESDSDGQPSGAPKHAEDAVTRNLLSQHRPDLAEAIYAGVSKSAFINPYATGTPVEDFCETYAFYKLHEVGMTEFNLRFLDGSHVNLMNRFAPNTELGEKVDFIVKKNL